MNGSLSILRRLTFVAIVAMIVAELSGCGGGDTIASGGIVGTGDSGRATQGTITALGSHSIVVNGQSFALTGVPITVNGQSATDSTLLIGMVVTVLTTVHSDGSVTVTGVQYA